MTLFLQTMSPEQSTPSIISLTESTSTISMANKQIKVAAIQAEPVWNDLQGGVDKAIAYIQEAASNGANVLGFPEVFIPGYPW